MHAWGMIQSTPSLPPCLLGGACHDHHGHDTVLVSPCESSTAAHGFLVLRYKGQGCRTTPLRHAEVLPSRHGFTFSARRSTADTSPLCSSKFLLRCLTFAYALQELRCSHICLALAKSDWRLAFALRTAKVSAALLRFALAKSTRDFCAAPCESSPGEGGSNLWKAFAWRPQPPLA